MVGRPIEVGISRRWRDIGSATAGFWARTCPAARFSRRHLSRPPRRDRSASPAPRATASARRSAPSAASNRPSGHVYCDGAPVRLGAPARGARRRHPLAQRRPAAGIDLPGPRRAREHDRAGARRLRRRRPRLGADGSAAARTELVDELGIVTPALDQPISGLSGGNQQKAVLARSFLYEAKAILIDEPTQGVDAKARFDIYRAIRAQADERRRRASSIPPTRWSSPASATASWSSRAAGSSATSPAPRSPRRTSSPPSSPRATPRGRAAEAAAGKPAEPAVWARLGEAIAGGSTRWWVPLVFLLSPHPARRRLCLRRSRTSS